jgi:hypothetical protein
MRFLLITAIIGALLPSTATADHLMCGQPAARTLTVYMEPGVDTATALAALDRWNEASGDIAGKPACALWSTGNPDVVIRPHHSTWVWYGCHGNSVLHWDSDPYWITHELGHSLGFADHVKAGHSTEGYINPGAQNGYDGIMNYASDVNLFTWDDLEMLWRWWN